VLLTPLSLKKREKVFRSRRNEERDGAEVTLGGNAFHARVPETGNALSPSEDCHVGCLASWLAIAGKLDKKLSWC